MKIKRILSIILVIAIISTMVSLISADDAPSYIVANYGDTASGVSIDKSISEPIYENGDVYFDITLTVTDFYGIDKILNEASYYVARSLGSGDSHRYKLYNSEEELLEGEAGKKVGTIYKLEIQFYDGDKYIKSKYVYIHDNMEAWMNGTAFIYFQYGDGSMLVGNSNFLDSSKKDGGVFKIDIKSDSYYSDLFYGKQVFLVNDQIAQDYMFDSIRSCSAGDTSYNDGIIWDLSSAEGNSYNMVYRVKMTTDETGTYPAGNAVVSYKDYSKGEDPGFDTLESTIPDVKISWPAYFKVVHNYIVTIIDTDGNSRDYNASYTDTLHDGSQMYAESDKYPEFSASTIDVNVDGEIYSGFNVMTDLSAYTGAVLDKGLNIVEVDYLLIIDNRKPATFIVNHHYTTQIYNVDGSETVINHDEIDSVNNGVTEYMSGDSYPIISEKLEYIKDGSAETGFTSLNDLDDYSGLKLNPGENAVDLFYERVIDNREPAAFIINHHYTTKIIKVDGSVAIVTHDEVDSVNNGTINYMSGDDYPSIREKPEYTKDGTTESGFTSLNDLNDYEGSKLSPGQNVVDLYYERTIDKRMPAAFKVIHHYKINITNVDGTTNIIYHEETDNVNNGLTAYMSGDGYPVITEKPQYTKDGVTESDFASLNNSDDYAGMKLNPGENVIDLYYVKSIDNRVPAAFIVNHHYTVNITNLDGSKTTYTGTYIDSVNNGTVQYNTGDQFPAVIPVYSNVKIEETFYSGFELTNITNLDDFKDMKLLGGINTVDLIYELNIDNREAAALVVNHHYKINIINVDGTINEPVLYNEIDLIHNGSTQYMSGDIYPDIFGKTEYTNDGVTQSGFTSLNDLDLFTGLKMVPGVNTVDLYYEKTVDSRKPATLTVYHHYKTKIINIDGTIGETVFHDETDTVHNGLLQYLSGVAYSDVVEKLEYIKNGTVQSGFTSLNDLETFKELKLVPGENTVDLYYERIIDNRQTASFIVNHHYQTKIMNVNGSETIITHDEIDSVNNGTAKYLSGDSYPVINQKLEYIKDASVETGFTSLNNLDDYSGLKLIPGENAVNLYYEKIIDNREPAGFIVNHHYTTKIIDADGSEAIVTHNEVDSVNNGTINYMSGDDYPSIREKMEYTKDGTIESGFKSLNNLNDFEGSKLSPGQNIVDLYYEKSIDKRMPATFKVIHHYKINITNVDGTTDIVYHEETDPVNNGSTAYMSGADYPVITEKLQYTKDGVTESGFISLNDSDDYSGMKLNPGENVIDLYYEKSIDNRVPAAFIVNHHYTVNITNKNGSTTTYTGTYMDSVNDGTAQYNSGDPFPAVIPVYDNVNVEEAVYSGLELINTADLDAFKDMKLLGGINCVDLYYELNIDNREAATFIVNHHYKINVINVDGSIGETILYNETDLVHDGSSKYLSGDLYPVISEKLEYTDNGVKQVNFTSLNDLDLFTGLKMVPGANTVDLYYEKTVDNRKPASLTVYHHYQTKIINVDGTVEDPIFHDEIDNLHDGSAQYLSGDNYPEIAEKLEYIKNGTEESGFISLNDMEIFKELELISGENTVDLYYEKTIDNRQPASLIVKHHYRINTINVDGTVNQPIFYDVTDSVHDGLKQYLPGDGYPEIAEKLKLTVDGETQTGFTSLNDLSIYDGSKLNPGENTIDLYYEKTIDNRQPASFIVNHHYTINVINEDGTAEIYTGTYIDNVNDGTTQYNSGDPYPDVILVYNDISINGISYSGFRLTNITDLSIYKEMKLLGGINTVDLEYELNIDNRKDASFQLIHKYTVIVLNSDGTLENVEYTVSEDIITGLLSGGPCPVNLESNIKTISVNTTTGNTYEGFTLITDLSDFNGYKLSKGENKIILDYELMIIDDPAIPLNPPNTKPMTKPLPAPSDTVIEIPDETVPLNPPGTGDNISSVIILIIAASVSMGTIITLISKRLFRRYKTNN